MKGKERKRGGGEEDRYRRKDMKAREGGNQQETGTATAVAPGDEPGGKPTLH